ncbi:MAG: carboxypeptidase regulatory-like domain-containing protein, partial [bacterium]|nr:carboxypeptidase regulatory-like domain-containing protein [bacterium]
VPPGQYTLVVDGLEEEVRLTGRRPLSVSAGDVESFEVLARPFDQLTGKLAAEEGSTVEFDPFRVSIEPHSDSTAGALVSVKANGEFTLPYVAGETYDVFLMEGPPESYLKSASIGGLDVLATGFRAQGGALPEMELVVSTKGGGVRGEIAEDATRVALGATVVLLPDPAHGRVQHYHATSTDEHGLYLFRGVAPGRYTVVAWREEPPCQIYDFDALAACRSAGESIEVEEATMMYVNLRIGEGP